MKCDRLKIIVIILILLIISIFTNTTSSAVYKNQEKVKILREALASSEGKSAAYERKIMELTERRGELESWISMCSDYNFPKCSGDVSYVRLTWSNSSMKTLLGNGFIFKSRMPKNIQLCDVVGFVSPEFNHSTVEEPVWHRVVGFNGTKLLTKGDSNTALDIYQPSINDVMGQVCV